MFDPKISAHRFFLMLSIVAIAACDLPRVQTFEKRMGGANPGGGGGGGQAADQSKRETENAPSADNSPHWIQIIPSNDTIFKTDPVDSGALLKNEKCVLHRGTRHSLAAEPEWIGAHVKIKLKQPMVGCPFTVGYVFAAHIGSSLDPAPTPSGKKFQTVTTLYTTENTPIEGGPKDRCGRKLNTLDDYMNWKANEVSVAMDRLALPYGTLIRIPEIEKRLKVAEPIPFKVVDTGSAFIGQGSTRMDICVGHNQETIFSSKYVWMSHGSFEFEVISMGKSFDCY
jgi:hypothetical protein